MREEDGYEHGETIVISARGLQLHFDGSVSRGKEEDAALRTEPLALEDFGKETNILNLWAKNNQSSFHYREKKNESFS